MTLTSPSGQIITRDSSSQGVTHALTGTSESYIIGQPEAGRWTVTLYGAQVAEDGEPVTLDSYQLPATSYQLPTPNQPPTATIGMTRQAGTVTVTAAGSQDPDWTSAATSGTSGTPRPPAARTPATPTPSPVPTRSR